MRTFFGQWLKKMPRSLSWTPVEGPAVWSRKILAAYESSSGCLCDISSDMLAVAQQSLGENERIKMIKDDIERLEMKDNAFDLSFNFQNVLGFVDSPAKALKELTRVTKPGGQVVSVAPNKFHCIFFNLNANRIDEAESALRRDVGTFTDDMPGMHLFTVESLRALYDQSGLEIKKIRQLDRNNHPKQSVLCHHVGRFCHS